MSQWSLFSVRAQDFSLDGASPNHSATAAFASGLMMWFIQAYMQFGFFASELIIQVSDQPVAPSDGSVFFTLAPSSWSRFVMTCQVVPTVLVPLANASTCLV